MAEEEIVLLPCNLGCGAILALQASIVGTRTPSVALCMPQGPSTGPIRTGPYKLWGDAATRVEYADPDDREKVVTHVVQLGVEPKVTTSIEQLLADLDVGVPVQDVTAEDAFKDFGIPWNAPSGDIE